MEKDAFYVVRKGDIVGVYKSLSDCQAQAGSSVCEPSVSVFKGYGLPKKAEEYLVSHGLKHAAYSISAADVQNDLFGKLIPCSIQEPASSGGKALHKNSQPSKPEEANKHAVCTEVDKYIAKDAPHSGLSYDAQNDGFFNHIPSIFWVGQPPSNGKESDEDHPPKRLQQGSIGSTSTTMNPPKKLLKTDNFVEPKVFSSGCSSCILEFDGASKGNPGPAGAGAVLRANDGSMVWRFREGVGIATNNMSEYRAIILGLKHALGKGFKHIRVQGDSNLVCMQVRGLWKIKNQNLAGLCKEAKELKDKFESFEIKHVPREFNSDADLQANQAVNLRDGQVEEDCEKR